MRSAIALTAALSAAACASMGFPRAHDDGGTPWVRIDTPHCSLFSNMEAGEGERVARQIELWWMAMAQVFPVGAADARPERARVIAVRNGWQADEVGANSIRGLYFGDGEIGDFLYVGEPTNFDGRETMRHELGHAFVGAHWPEVPQWLNEGLAGYLQTADFDDKHHLVTWGARNLPETRDQILYGRQVSASEIIAPAPWKRSDVGDYSYEAGLLVHMLVTRYPAELECYLGTLQKRTPGTAAGALKACFHSVDRWNFELQDYAFGPVFGFATKSASFTPPSVAPTTSPVDDGDAHTLLALLDLEMLEYIAPAFHAPRIERADHNLERALSLAPTNELAMRLALRSGKLDPARREVLTRRLTEQHPADWRAWLARAKTPGLAEQETRKACEQVRRYAPENLEGQKLAPCGGG